MSSSDLSVPDDGNEGPGARGAVEPAYPPAMPPRFGEEEEAGIDFRRLLAGILRYKWMILALGLMGFGAAWLVYNNVEPEYMAQGSLLLDRQPPRGEGADMAPIRQAPLFQEEAWIELLMSFSVLDPVVLSERLYLSHDSDDAPVFADFDVDREGYATGSFRLVVSEDGSELRLLSEQGILIDTAAPGDSLGTDLGLRWQPPADALAPEQDVRFTLVQPRDASRALQDNLQPSMDQVGNFLSLTLTGTDPQRIASIINAVMERHVELSAELKRDNVGAELNVMLGQLSQAQDSLSQYELELERFRTQTITLPSEQSTPIAAGLAVTQTPMLNNYFDMRSQLELRRSELQRMQSVMDRLAAEGVRVEAIEAVEVARNSTELSNVLEELVATRGELRRLRQQYTDEYAPIQELLGRIETLEEETIPSIVQGIVNEMQSDVRQLQTRVDSAAVELEQIPQRAIEEARLQRQVRTQGNIVSDLEERVATARLAAASSTPDVRIMDQSVVPVIPSSDQRVRLAGLTLIAFWGIGIGLALLLDRIDPRFRYPDQATSDMGLEILGSIPRILPSNGRKGAERAMLVAEAFRELRMRVTFAHGSAGPIALTVTSPAQSEGKSLIATNLAVAFAEMGRRTLLIDGDVRRGDAHVLIGCERAPGLTDYLKEKASGDIIRSTDYERLDFIPSGSRSADSPELLASSRMASFMGTLKRGYDVIIVDSPPLAAGADPLVLGRLTGSLLMVLRTGSTDRSLAEAKLELLSRIPLRILGAVLNDIEPKGMYRYYSNYLPEYAPTAEMDEAEMEGEHTPVLGPKTD